MSRQQMLTLRSPCRYLQRKARPLGSSSYSVADRQVSSTEYVYWPVKAGQRLAWDYELTKCAIGMAEELYPPSYAPGPDGINYIGKQTQYFNEWNQANYLKVEQSSP